MGNNLFLNKSYIDWLNLFLEKNNNFIRVSDNEYFINISKEDDDNSNELFMFFRRLLRYSKIHNIATNVFEKEIYEKYGSTYLCFDCSLLFKYKKKLINIIVLELGGASDMIVRVVSDYIHDKDIINIEDFYDWIYDYKYGSISCLDCCNLKIINVDYKVSGIDYKCGLYNESCFKEYGILIKNKDRIYPCSTCRRNNNINYKK